MSISDAINLLFSCLNKNEIKQIKNILLAYINLYIEPLKMSSWPILIQIEPTLHCNLECKMCINPVISRDRRHMSFGEFKKILDKMPSTIKISLVGAGEPLMNPYLFDMLKYAKEKGIAIGFATNGMLLSNEICKKIIETEVDWVNISMDSANQEKYEVIRKDADFNLLLNNIKNLIRLKNHNRLPKVSLWFVIMAENFKELPEMIKCTKELGVKNVSAQLAHSWNNDIIKSIISGLNFNSFEEELKTTLIITKQLAQRNRVKFDYVNIPGGSSGRKCKWPWKSCYITAEGFVTPCCLQGANPQTINFGNLFKDNFEDIWNNSAYQNFRKALKSKLPPDICFNCPSYYSTLKI